MGRPPKTSRAEILAAAATFDAADLQLTALAEELGISVKTIYYYFPNRGALLDALTERAVAGFELPDLARLRSWRSVLTETARWSRRIGSSEPTWRADPAEPHGAAVELIRLVADRLVRLGWPEESALRAIVLVTTWAFAVGRAEQSSSEPADLDRFADPDTVVRLMEHLSAFGPEGIFDDGLRTLLAGIEKECAP